MSVLVGGEPPLLWNKNMSQSTSTEAVHPAQAPTSRERVRRALYIDKQGWVRYQDDRRHWVVLDGAEADAWARGLEREDARPSFGAADTDPSDDT